MGCVKMTTLYLIRHAQAEGNIKRIFQGHTDAYISECGKVQLERLKTRFENIPFDVIYSSPLKRAFETAQAVNSLMKKEIIINEDLIEINGGKFEGERWDDLPDLFPNEYELWANNHGEFAAPDGESMPEVYDRMKNAINTIVKNNTGKTIVVVSHGCAIRNYLCYAMGNCVTEIDEVDWCDNTAISKIGFDEDLNPRIELLNDASHLDSDISTLAKQTWWQRKK